MALETTDNRKEYAGNGATLAFAFPYYFLADADLVVILRNNTTGAEVLKVLTTDYTVTGAGTEAGGTVTMIVAPASGYTLIIYRDPAITQGTDFRENDSLPAESTEEAFDRAAMISQRLSERVDRSVRLSDGFSPDFDLTLPADLDDAAGKLPLINATSDGFADAADWPDIDGTTAAMAASAAAAAASASAAATSATASATSAAASATSATASATSATASAASATNSASSATAASGSATAAAASATAAANTLASALWRGVLRKTSADSPYTVTSADNGKLLVVDTTSGAVTINLPSIAALTPPFTLGIQLDAGTNAITVNRNGTDTIDGATSKSITVAGSGAQFLADTTPAPDEWEVIDFGAQAGNMTVDAFSGTGAQVAFVLSVDPGSKNNTWVYINGVMQQKANYSLSGTTLTFVTAPPAGSSNIEVVSGTVLTIGTPSDNTVNNAKLTSGAVTPAKVTFIPPTIRRFTTTGAATYNRNYAFIIASGSATAGATYTNNGITYTVHQTVSSALLVVMNGSGAPASSGTLTKASGTGDSTLTFTEAVAARYAFVEAAGGGGGGGGSSTTGGSGNNGTDTTVGSTLIIAGAGQGGAGGSAGGATGPAGGTVSVDSTLVTVRADAGMRGGGAANNNNSGGTFRFAEGGPGGANAFGGAGAQGASAAAGQNAVANTGGGGGGAGCAGSANASSGAGGGAGAYVKALIQNLAASYALVVGAKGTGGGAGTGSIGGDGADGIIIFTEHYY
jgi:hypothetical protein